MTPAQTDIVKYAGGGIAGAFLARSFGARTLGLLIGGTGGLGLVAWLLMHPRIAGEDDDGEEGEDLDFVDDDDSAPSAASGGGGSNDSGGGSGGGAVPTNTAAPNSPAIAAQAAEDMSGHPDPVVRAQARKRVEHMSRHIAHKTQHPNPQVRAQAHAQVAHVQHLARTGHPGMQHAAHALQQTRHKSKHR